jgi:hypothetical protein
MISHSRENPSSSPAEKAFCANLLQAIHAAAQPLTILRAGLGNSEADQISLEALRELTTHSAAEVERLCLFFSYIQQFVITESFPPHLAVAELPPLLEHVVDGVGLLFETSGMHLTIELPGACPSVLIDSARTPQALSSVLLLAHSLSRSQDTVQLLVSWSASEVKLIVENQNACVKSFNAEENLSIALAESNIRSQKGTFSYTTNPFRVQIQLATASFQS